jgi:hypothetical protein
MIQCRIFSGADVSKVGEELNLFFRTNEKIIIDSIHQSVDSKLLYISVFYHLKMKTDKIKEAAIEEIKVPVKSAFENNS